MTTTISREYWFSAAHRLEGHPKCGRLHGHNYRVVVTVRRHPDAVQALDDQGMIMDYGQLDMIIKPLIDGTLDHRYIVSQTNKAAADPYYVHGVPEHMVVLPIDTSTAENLGAWLFHKIQERLPTIVRVVSVMVEETPKSGALVVYA